MPAKLGLFFLWILLTPIVLGYSIFLLGNSGKVTIASNSIVAQETINNSLDGQVLGTQIADIRPIQVENILKNTVLAPYSQYMVEIADKYSIDYKLIPAIAMKESGGGNKAPKGTFNAWGFENGSTQFDSWEQAIDIVGKTLKIRYVDRGLITPDQIMPVYAPPAVKNGGGWAKDVNYFFSQLEKAP